MGIARRTFLATSALAMGSSSMQSSSPNRGSVTQSILVYRDGESFHALGAVDRRELFSSRYASEVLQKSLDLSASRGGGRVTIEPGVYPLSTTVVLKPYVSVVGAGNSTQLIVPRENKEGIAVLGERADGAMVADLLLDGDYKRNPDSAEGIVIDDSADVTLERLFARGFHKFGIHIRNNCAFLKLTGCTAGCNDMANFRMTKLSGSNDSRLGWFVPNLINNCYAYGGGHGFELNNCICQNVVGCETYQVKGVGFYINNYGTSNSLSGCRAFMGRKQAVFWENSDEMNITSGMFCWHEDHAIEVRNCTWGIIAGNDIMDTGAGIGSTKHQIYLHTDVKSVQVTANCIFCWGDQYPSVSGIYEDEECRDNSFVGNVINNFVKDGIISKGQNTLVANNLYQPEPGRPAVC